jgi:hypothetical protein
MTVAAKLALEISDLEVEPISIGFSEGMTLDRLDAMGASTTELGASCCCQPYYWVPSCVACCCCVA